MRVKCTATPSAHHFLELNHLSEGEGGAQGTTSGWLKNYKKSDFSKCCVSDSGLENYGDITDLTLSVRAVTLIFNSAREFSVPGEKLPNNLQC